VGEALLRHYRWVLVGIGVLVLGLLPALAAARPAPSVKVDPVRLRQEILASVNQPYQGFADSTGGIRLPDLPQLNDVNALLSGGTTTRAWYASSRSWRVAVIEPTGERDTYRAGDLRYIWDFERNLVTQITGELPVRLPWAPDVLPPDLARRLLADTSPADRLIALPARRIAGIAAAGVRLVPGDPQTTIGRVDVWADPRTGLPLRVEVASRTGNLQLFTARFLELRQEAPPPAVLAPPSPPGAGFTVTSAPDVAAAINSQASFPLPPRLAGRNRVQLATSITGVGGYGIGLSTFVALPLPGRLGPQTFNAARDAGAEQLTIPNADGYEVRTSVITTIVVRSVGGRANRRTYLLAGFVTRDVLEQAAAELFRRRRA
jgi:hypothetical protein